MYSLTMFRIISENDVRDRELPLNTFIEGDAYRVLRKLPSNSVNLVVTSPPYYGKRDYKHPDQIGLEDDFEEYIDKLVRVCKEIYRVLRADGCFYLNIDDTYSGSHCGSGDNTLLQNFRYRKTAEMLYQKPSPQAHQRVKRKSMLLIPFRLTIRLVDEVGFILRNVIIWHKTNAMPESVKDRFSRKYEFIFFFTKSEDYYFNLDNVREPYSWESLERLRRFINYYMRTGKTISDENKLTKLDPDELAKLFSNASVVSGRSIIKLINESGTVKSELSKTEQFSISELDKDRMRGIHRARAEGMSSIEEILRIVNLRGKNPGDVWSFSTAKFKGAHFAVFPLELPVRCILASCPPNGVVLDPFSGVGTVALACILLNMKRFDIIEQECSFPINDLVRSTNWNLKFIMIDIKRQYHEMAIERIQNYIDIKSKSILEYLK